jgi:ubiquinone/menaquinone biosynthesis C-methylase UbiE
MPPVNYFNKCLSTDKILNGVLQIFKDNLNLTSHGAHLDIGSGSGALVKLIKQVAPNFSSNCVDYTDKLIDDKSIPLAVVDLNFEKLPHNDNSFEFVTCTEVIEHLENYRLIIREAFRVTKPGGLVVFTTPNVLNLNSRLRYFNFGFHSLFGPLPIDRDEAFSTGGHITPVQYFYLAHSLAEAGFTNIEVQFDKKQTSAIPWLILFYPLINIFSFMASRREARKGFINEKNKSLMQPIRSIDMLLGRTIIVSAKKLG